MTMCDKLIDELKKCLLNKKKIINIKQIIIKQEPSLMDDVDTEYSRIKTNIYELNNKLFNCENKDSIKEYLNINKLEISSEDYPNMLESRSYHNNITIKKIE